jgi:hypothetical protein
MLGILSTIFLGTHLGARAISDSYQEHKYKESEEYINSIHNYNLSRQKEVKNILRAADMAQINELRNKIKEAGIWIPQNIYSFEGERTFIKAVAKLEGWDYKDTSTHLREVSAYNKRR